MMTRSRSLVAFVAVGGLCTLIYAGLAMELTTRTGLMPALASALAYVVSAIFGFVSHRRFTFASSARIGRSLPRFLAASALGYGLSAGIPLFFTQFAQLPAGIGIAAVCIIVPAVNFVTMRLFVFASSEGAAGLT